MIGVVLCGGQSLRMGSDKGLLKNEEGVFWSALAYQKLAILVSPIVVSVNQRQGNYISLFSNNQLIIDNASLGINGPLLGLISVHLQFPDEDLMILACDMIDMKTEVLSFLHGQYKIKGCEAMVFSNHDLLEPLCGIYSSLGLKKIFSLFQNKGLTKHSMQFVLKELSTIQLKLPNHWENCFHNYNYSAKIEMH